MPQIYTIFPVKLMLKHSSVLFTVRNCIPTSYLVTFYLFVYLFAASEMTNCLNNVTKSFQETFENHTRNFNFIN